MFNKREREREREGGGWGGAGRKMKEVSRKTLKRLFRKIKNFQVPKFNYHHWLLQKKIAPVKSPLSFLSKNKSDIFFLHNCVSMNICCYQQRIFLVFFLFRTTADQSNEKALMKLCQFQLLEIFKNTTKVQNHWPINKLETHVLVTELSHLIKYFDLHRITLCSTAFSILRKGPSFCLLLLSFTFYSMVRWNGKIYKKANSFLLVNLDQVQFSGQNMWTILIFKSWWWLLKPKRSTTSLHHNIFTYLFFLCFFLLPSYCRILIHIFTNLISTSIHGTRKKTKKPPSGTRDKSISNHCPGKKEKIIGQKERKGQPRPTRTRLAFSFFLTYNFFFFPRAVIEKNQGIRSQLVKRKLKAFRESCNATITKVLNTSGANYKTNLNRELEIFY